MKNIAFIINPMSGTQNKRRLPKQINELLDKRQWLENIVFTEHTGHALTLAKQYATMGFDAIVAVGGDGTVREVAEGVAGSRSALGIIPMGLTNTLARHLGIPLRGNASITWLNRSEPVLCDCMEVAIDDGAKMLAMTEVVAGDTRFINCAQGSKASIQDGELTISELTNERVNELTINDERVNELAFSGTALVDGEEHQVEERIQVVLRADNIYVLAPKRF